MHFYASSRVVTLRGPRGPLIRRACYLKRNSRFIRVDVFAFPARHICTCAKITLRHVQAAPVIALVIIAALLDLVPYSQKIRPCHRAARAKIDMPYKKRLNEQEHVRERRTCRTHFNSHVKTVNNFELRCGLYVFL